MQEAYEEYNEHAEASGNSHGHFMVDLCRPGHMTACLRTFQVHGWGVFGKLVQMPTQGSVRTAF